MFVGSPGIPSRRPHVLLRRSGLSPAVPPRLLLRFSRCLFVGLGPPASPAPRPPLHNPFALRRVACPAPPLFPVSHGPGPVPADEPGRDCLRRSDSLAWDGGWRPWSPAGLFWASEGTSGLAFSVREMDGAVWRSCLKRVWTNPRCARLKGISPLSVGGDRQASVAGRAESLHKFRLADPLRVRVSPRCAAEAGNPRSGWDKDSEEIPLMKGSEARLK